MAVDTFQLYFTAHVTGTTVGSVLTTAAQAIGPAAADRYVIAVVTTQENATITAVTIGGIAATSVVSAIDAVSNPDMLGAIWWAAVPTGTTGVVTVTLSAADDQIGVSLFRIVGHETTASDTDSATGSAATKSLSALTLADSGGVVLGFSNNTDTTAVTWTGAIGVSDADDGTHRHSAAMRLGGPVDVTPTFTADGATADQVLVGAAFARTALTGNGGNDSNTKLLVSFDGMNASTLFFDRGATGHLLTAVGNAQVDTAFSQFGGGSLLLDGTGDSVSISDHADFDRGSSNFTIDCWVRPAALPAGDPFTIFAHIGADVNNMYRLYLNVSGTIAFQAVDAGAGTVSFASTGAISGAVWSHVALVRNGSTFTIYINGVADGTASYAGAITDYGGLVYIGTLDGTNWPWSGHIDEVRFSHVARWTGNFTPQTTFYSVEADAAPGGGNIAVKLAQYRQRWGG